MSDISALGLARMAASVAAAHRAKGAVIVTFGEEGFRIGDDGLTVDELQTALCLAIHDVMARIIDDREEIPERG